MQKMKKHFILSKTIVLLSIKKPILKKNEAILRSVRTFIRL